MNKFYLLFIFCITVGIFSCTKDTDPNPGKDTAAWIKDSYAWYPLEIGNQWTYSVDSVYFSTLLGKQVRDTVSGIYRESITDTFSSQGQLNYRILREKQNGNNWDILNVYAVKWTKQNVIRTEDNVSLIDLIFPVSLYESWDPYKFTDKNKDFLIKGNRILLYNNFNDCYISDSTSQVVLGNSVPVISILDGESDDQLILRQYSKRWYAKGIGLIRKEQEFFSDQTTLDRNIPWVDKAEVGFILREELIDYK